MRFFYLEHKKDGVQYNEGHDEILKGSRLYDSPQLVFITLPFLKECYNVIARKTFLLYSSVSSTKELSLPSRRV